MSPKHRNTVALGLTLSLGVSLLWVWWWTSFGVRPTTPALVALPAHRSNVADDPALAAPRRGAGSIENDQTYAPASPNQTQVERQPPDQAKPHAPDFYDLIRDTEHPDWAIRWDAVNELGKSKDPRAVTALVQRVLYDENSHPRWRSLWALKAIDASGSEAISMFADALGDPDGVVVRNAAVGLAFFGQAEGRAELLRGLDDPDTFRRWEAIYSLRSIGNPEVATELASLLEPQVESEVRVRGEAALSLGYMGGPEEIVPPLVNALRTDESPQVRWRAALTLSKVGDPSILDALEEVRRTEQDPQVRKYVDAALRRVRRTN